MVFADAQNICGGRQYVFSGYRHIISQIGNRLALTVEIKQRLAGNTLRLSLVLRHSLGCYDAARCFQRLAVVAAHKFYLGNIVKCLRTVAGIRNHFLKIARCGGIVAFAIGYVAEIKVLCRSIFADS